MDQVNWYGKPYYSLDAYCKNTFHHKCYKIALNAHMTCPNRDGTLGTRGCIFCSAGGSGDFAVSVSSALASWPADSTNSPVLSDSCQESNDDLTDQLKKGIQLFGDKKVGQHFIAYFQAFTNTYAPVSYLEKQYTQALDNPLVCGISIATRPDCLPSPVLSLLKELKEKYPDKFIWIELGLQTIHESTALYIRRGYDLPVFEKAVSNLAALSIPVIVHVILGLPGETDEMMYETISYLNTLEIMGIKLQLLHILRDTDLASDYLEGKVLPLSKEHYLTLVIECIKRLRPDIVIHRVTGDGPKDLLLAPEFSKNKRDVLNSLHMRMRAEGAIQGMLYRTKPNF